MKPTPQRFAIGLVAHDRMKAELADWVATHRERLAPHRLYATGTTASVLARAVPGLDLVGLKSGPMGGDQQLGSLIATRELQALVFLSDPMTPQPHDSDVKALLRLAILYDIPVACNRATADLLFAVGPFEEIACRPARPPEERFADYMHRPLPPLESG